MDKASVIFTVNGREVAATVDPRTLLVHFLREELRAHRHPYRLRHQPVRGLHRSTSTAGR